jgi:integrase/recombinase XerD
MESYTYNRYVESYKEWLALLNYAASTMESLPRQIREFFTWMESHGVHNIEQITREHIREYYQYMKYTRKSQHTDTFLKSQTLNGHIRGLKLFSFYLEETQQARLIIDLPYEEKEPSVKHLLTAREVQLLYQATTEDEQGIKERAMLSLYYGCGLRSNEGIMLNLEDVMLDKKIVYVRQGKGYKERYVPFVDKQKEHFEHYLKYVRSRLVKDQDEQAFLVGSQGRRIRYDKLLKMLKQLQERTEDEMLQQKRIGLHALRHSIATHLMQRGMKFDYISQFLGHTNLSSTQIYTHLAHEYENTNTP